MTKPNLYIIAVCNGAGKTTVSFTLLPEILDCKEFVNADEIAKGLSPFQPETVAFEAGRIMLHRINELLNEGNSFAFETTLSTKSYKQKIVTAKEIGYQVTLLFFWLNSIELAKERVKMRVSEGGHNIPEETIERRYKRGIVNLFDIYIPIVDELFIFDNSFGSRNLIADRKRNGEISIIETEEFNHIKELYNEFI